MILLYAVAGAAPAGWIYERAAIANGEWWRLVTGHFSHSDPVHLLLNVAALIVIGSLLERQRPVGIVAGILAGIVSVNALLWLWLPGMERYCGFSGVLNTLLVLLLARLWSATRSGLVIAVAGVYVIKLVVEILTGTALLTHTAWSSVPLAHVAGVCGGLVVLAAREDYQARTRPVSRWMKFEDG